jgi:ABC-2 type transport system permease protein
VFSKPIFRQSLRSSYVLWLCCTVVLTAMLSLMAAFHNPGELSIFLEAIEDTPMMAEAGEQLDLFSSLLGIITQTVYGFSGLMIAMVYVVVTANSLVASEVDRGSMAYTLSTPTKRSTVVFTKAVYLFLSVVVMFIVIGGVGAATIQAKHHGIWGTAYSEDVKAAAEVLDAKEEVVAGGLWRIMADPVAFMAGAAARDVDADVYAAYLGQAMQRDAYAAAANVLGKTAKEVENTPALARDNDAALAAAASVLGTNIAGVRSLLDQLIAQQDTMAAQKEMMKTALTNGLRTAAAHLGMETSALVADLNLLKENEPARAVARDASGLDETTFATVLNQAIASGLITEDQPVSFDAFAFLMLNIGMLLLMLAVSGISFLASCIFNLSKHSLALGAGLPFAFLILNLLSTVNETLEPLKYFSLMTLFDTEQILREGTYWPQFVGLLVVGIVLYALAIRIFQRKDLPL